MINIKNTDKLKEKKLIIKGLSRLTYNNVIPGVSLDYTCTQANDFH